MIINKSKSCQSCTKEFYSDSPYNDTYCGDCRVNWYEREKLRMKEYYQKRKELTKIKEST